MLLRRIVAKKGANFRHCPDHVVCIFGDKAIDPAKCGPLPSGEVHRHQRHQLPVVLTQLLLVRILDCEPNLAMRWT